MGTALAAPPAKLFMAVMHRPSFDPSALLEMLAGDYGAVILRSETFPFTHSEYYGAEMGPGLLKFLVCFGPLVPQEALPAIKLRTNGLEKSGADREGKRAYNLDPGLVTLSGVVLATTKGHAHRVYMGDGIWEEVTLIYRSGAFEPLPWTYPDYRLPPVLAFLKEAREIYHLQLSARQTGHA